MHKLWFYTLISTIWNPALSLFCCLLSIIILISCYVSIQQEALILFSHCQLRDNSSSMRCEYYILHFLLLSVYGVRNNLNLTLPIMLNFSDHSLKSVRIRWQFTKIKNDIYFTIFCMIHQIFSILTLNYVFNEVLSK